MKYFQCLCDWTIFFDDVYEVGDTTHLAVHAVTGIYLVVIELLRIVRKGK